MKAIRVENFGGPEVMNLKEIANLIPAAGQVLVKVHAAGVNPVDVQCHQGLHAWINLPYTPGFDGAGVVQSIGPGVLNVKPGDRVYTAFNISGTYAEEVLCQSDQVWPLPDSVSFEEGAGVYIPYGTAYRALYQRCKVQKGETILIHGASGAVGLAATQFAAAEGCIVLGSAGNERGRQIVKDQGARYVVDHYQPEHYQQIMELTDGRGVDVILEMVSANIKQDIGILAHRGRIAVIGDRSPIELDAAAVTAKDASILGTNIGNLPAETAEEMHAAIYAGLENKTLHPIIFERLTLKEAGKAHEMLAKSETYGKVVLIL